MDGQYRMPAIERIVEFVRQRAHEQLRAHAARRVMASGHQNFSRCSSVKPVQQKGIPGAAYRGRDHGRCPAGTTLPHEIKMVVDVRAGGTPLTGTPCTTNPMTPTKPRSNLK